MIPLQGNQLLERYLNVDPQKDSSLRIQQEYKHLFRWIHKIPQPETTIDQRWHVEMKNQMLSDAKQMCVTPTAWLGNWGHGPR